VGLEPHAVGVVAGDVQQIVVRNLDVLVRLPARFQHPNGRLVLRTTPEVGRRVHKRIVVVTVFQACMAVGWRVVKDDVPVAFVEVEVHHEVLGFIAVEQFVRILFDVPSSTSCPLAVPYAHLVDLPFKVGGEGPPDVGAV